MEPADVSSFADLQAAAAERIKTLSLLALPEAIVQAEVERRWKEVTETQIKKLVSAEIHEIVGGRVKAIVKEWHTEDVDSEIMSHLRNLAREVSGNAQAAFWSAAGHKIVEIVLGSASEQFVSCGTCGKVRSKIASRSSGACECGGFFSG